MRSWGWNGANMKGKEKWGSSLDWGSSFVALPWGSLWPGAFQRSVCLRTRLWHTSAMLCTEHSLLTTAVIKWCLPAPWLSLLAFTKGSVVLHFTPWDPQAGGTLTVSFAVNNVLRVKRLRVNNSISSVAQCTGFPSRHGELRDRYSPSSSHHTWKCICALPWFPPAFQNHTIATAPNQVCQQHLSGKTDKNSLSHDGSAVDTKIKSMEE